jgi:hypothetical protein
LKGSITFRVDNGALLLGICFARELGLGLKGNAMLRVGNRAFVL